MKYPIIKFLTDQAANKVNSTVIQRTDSPEKGDFILDCIGQLSINI